MAFLVPRSVCRARRAALFSARGFSGWGCCVLACLTGFGYVLLRLGTGYIPVPNAVTLAQYQQPVPKRIPPICARGPDLVPGPDPCADTAAGTGTAAATAVSPFPATAPVPFLVLALMLLDDRSRAPAQAPRPRHRDPRPISPTGVPTHSGPTGSSGRLVMVLLRVPGYSARASSTGRVRARVRYCVTSKNPCAPFSARLMAWLTKA